MPNQRSPHKKGFGIYLDAKLLERIKEYCVRHGIDRVEFLRQAAEAKLKQKRTKEKKV